MLKAAGILCVILGASGAGFSMALGVRRSISVMQQLLAALEQMKSEMEYRKTPLPELMRVLAVSARGGLADFFGCLSDDLHLRQEGSVYAIVRKNLAATPAGVFSPQVRHILLNLGSGLGKYDLPGQLRAVDLAMDRLRSLLEQCQAEQRSRIRSYCTLGVCAGLAIAIIAW